MRNDSHGSSMSSERSDSDRGESAVTCDKVRSFLKKHLDDKNTRSSWRWILLYITARSYVYSMYFETTWKIVY